MSKKNKKGSKIRYFLTLIILCIALYYTYQYYKTNDFNDFIRSEIKLYTSNFQRDSQVRFENRASYKIESPEYNDAMFYKKIQVNKNTPYKVTCMVKTNNVESKEETSGVGAQISIEGTTERSIAISGTQDWQKIELIFNSKNREELNLGFRLGGYLGEAKGEAWFSNFSIEEGTASENSDWKFECFIFETTDVNLNGNQIKLQVTQNDKKDIKNTIKLFETSCKELSKGKMTASCDIYEVDTPLSKLSYDNEFGYFVAPEDVEEQIKDKISENDYDHIFVIVRLGDEKHLEDIEVNDWIGLRFYGLLWNRLF